MRKTSKTAAFATFSFGHYEVSMTNPNLLQSNVLWIDVSKYCFSSIWFSICFFRLDRDKTTNLKNIKLSFYKINFTTCSPINKQCLKTPKPGVFFLLNLHQYECIKYRCQMFHIYRSSLSNHCSLLSEISYKLCVCGNRNVWLY